MIKATKEYQKSRWISVILNPPHSLVIICDVKCSNFRETEEYEVVLFCRTNTLVVKERTGHSQECDFPVS